MKNALVAQSGGPSVAINSSLAGVISACCASTQINTIYGARNGIEGVINRNIVPLNTLLPNLIRLMHTPAMALGSCRCLLPKMEDNLTLYEIIANTLLEYDIGYFFYIGGNDSMDTVIKLNDYFTHHRIDIKVFGVPKTIDNDLMHTDHTPGYGSAAKYLCRTMIDIIKDCEIYFMKSVTIVEIMGRHTGWLALAASLPRYMGYDKPHMLYIPERDFDDEAFLSSTRKLLETENNVIIAVAEGVHYANGVYVGASSGAKDTFGHSYLSGAGKYLEGLVAQQIGCKVRSIELNVLQRCTTALASSTDLEEAFIAGEKAVQYALEGHSGKMVTFLRKDNPYHMETGMVDAKEVAHFEKAVPLDYVDFEKGCITQKAYDYIVPLMQGNVTLQFDQLDMPKYLKI